MENQHAIDGKTIFSMAIFTSYVELPEGNYQQLLPGWWFGTFFIFPFIGNNHPN